MIEWRGVVGFEGQYEVSADGRVRRVARELVRANGWPYRVAEHELSQVVMGRGYRAVAFKVARKTNRTRLVHRLVAEAFLPNPDALPHVNHKNLDKTDNRVDNLEWCTEAQNQQHAADRGRFHGRTNPNARFKLQPAQVDEILARLARGEFQDDLAAEFGVSQSMISAIKTGKSWAQPGVAK